MSNRREHGARVAGLHQQCTAMNGRGKVQSSPFDGEWHNENDLKGHMLFTHIAIGRYTLKYPMILYK